MTSGKCQAPDCDKKNYDQCKISENANDVCTVSGATGDQVQTCIQNDGSVNYTVDQSECSQETSQVDCGEKLGCIWDYIPTSASPLAKGCKVGTSQTCSSQLNRYSLESKETFGCDKEHCTYTHGSGARLDGQCKAVENTNTPTCEPLGKSGCENDERCVWVANDGAHCGYHRNVEYYLHITPGTTDGESNIDKLDVGATGATPDNDPCLKIKNPGSETCEGQGCIWDIYGSRLIPNIYNDTVNTNYYDINTSGLCIMPRGKACMDHFCHKESGPAVTNWELPDGKCEDAGNNTTCSPTLREIVTERTPGLIDFRAPLPDPITRNFHSTQDTAERANINEVNYLLAVEYEKIKGDSSLSEDAKRDKTLLTIKDIYKENCELNINHPTSATQASFVKGYNQYDINTGTCSGVGTDPNLETYCQTDPDFYHKDKTSTTYGLEKTCTEKSFSNASSITNAMVQRDDGVATARHSSNVNTAGFDQRIYAIGSLAGTTPTLSNTQGVTTAPVIDNKTFATADYDRAKQNIDCRNKFYEIVELLETKIGVWDGTSGTATAMSANIRDYTTSTEKYPKTPTGVGVLIESLKEDFVAETATPSTTAIATGLGVVTADTSGVYDKIKDYIVSLSNQLHTGFIDEDEYKNSVARYLASFVNYTDSTLNCVYNPYIHEYVQYVGGAATDAQDQEYYQFLAEELPVRGTVGATMSDFIGKSTADPTIEKTLKVKDMIYKKGNAVVTLQLYNAADAVGKKIEVVENYDKNSEYGQENFIATSKHTHIPGGPSDTLSKYANLFKLDTHQIVDGTRKLYVGGMLEFEIDNVDPGCFNYDAGQFGTACVLAGKHITLEGEDGLYNVFTPFRGSGTAGGVASAEWRVKEVRFKDVPMDIYFQGDIDGLFKVNDLISITDDGELTTVGGHSIVKIFNKNNIYDTSAADEKYYQKVKKVDIEKNKITVENAIRRGPYFIGRGDLEEQYHGDAVSCVTDSSYGANVDILSRSPLGDNDDTYCDVKELYEYCSGLSAGDCATNDLCVEDSARGTGQVTISKCLPKLTADTGLDTDYARDGLPGVGLAQEKVRCNEIYDIKVPLQKTKCAVQYASATENKQQYEDMINTMSGAPVAITSEYIQDDNSFYDISPLASRADDTVPLVQIQKDDYLKFWRVKYISAADTTSGTLNIKEGIIEEHKYTPAATGSVTATHKIKIKKAGGSSENEMIYILSFRPPYIYDYIRNLPGSEVNNSFDITVGIFAKNNLTNPTPTCTETATTSVAADAAACAAVANLDNATACEAVQLSGAGTGSACTYNDGNSAFSATKEFCEYNNGTWNHTCKAPLAGDPDSTDSIRIVDLCERTGFIFDEKSNVCYKDKNAGTADDLYCTNKTNTSLDTTWSASRNPCGVCHYNTPDSDNTQTCDPLPRSECSKKEEGSCDTSNSCEYYRDNMNAEIVTKSDGTEITPRWKSFTCAQGAAASCSTAARITSKDRCEGTASNMTGCEWKCPYIDANVPPGYTIGNILDGSPPTFTPPNSVSTDNYYSPLSLSVQCDDSAGWVAVGESDMPKAQCIVNVDDNSNSIHAGVMDFVGCVKTLNCRNIEYLPENLNAMMNTNPLSVPDDFKKNDVLDSDEFPMEDGSYKCPAPKQLVPLPDNVAGWSIEACCQHVGLCTDNDNINDNVACPSGQEIKRLYYEDSDELLPAIGSTISQCCVSPDEPTVTVPLDADYSELIGSEDSIQSEGFKASFIADIVELLNASQHTTVVVVPEMIEVINIKEGSVIVTFKIKKDTGGNVILKEQISRTLLAGTTFERLSTNMKGVVTFEDYDRYEKYLYYSNTYKTGITPEQFAISIFVTFSLCFFCLVVLGMLFK